MTNEQIKNEVSRWINADRPKVWYKSKNVREWTYTVGPPSWDAEATYIVDDEWAELRKSAYDGFTIQWRYTEDEKWEDIEDISSLEYILYVEGDAWKVYRIKSKKPTIRVGDWCIDPKTKKPKQVTNIHFNSGINLWMFSTNNGYDVYVVSDFVPTEEPVYEWQWYVKSSDGKCELTDDFWTEDDNLAPELQKFEPSKRERKG